MSKKINIEGSIDIIDPFYRYTMIKMNVIKQKNKTIIDNLDAVCSDLDREPKLVVDYFKRKFSVSMLYKDNVLSTTSNITYDQFYQALREFIEYYVLCEKCRLPETEIQIKGDKMKLGCKCCSHVNIKLLKK